MPFNHDNLKVYQRTLAFNVKVDRCVADWDSKHALCDHLPRAAASILENIAMASASSSAMKLRSLEYATGSALECAACLDLAAIKRLMDRSVLPHEKGELSQILRMLVGLRRAWARSMVTEEHEEYDVPEGARKIDKDSDKGECEGSAGKVFFHHEKLDVYSIACQTARDFSISAAVQRLPNTVFRRLDSLLTSMLLNIAEGNGRFSSADQRRFLDTSREAAIKMAARLDLCDVQGLVPSTEVQSLKLLLSRVAAMTWSMAERV